MNCYRIVYLHNSSGYSTSSFSKDLKLVYIPKEKDEVIPCLYFTNDVCAEGKLVVFFHGTYEDLGCDVLVESCIDMGR